MDDRKENMRTTNTPRANGKPLANETAAELRKTHTKIGCEMDEATTSKYSEREVNEMVRAHAGEINDIWEQHHTWKAIRIAGVRILHAFKRQNQLYKGGGQETGTKTKNPTPSLPTIS